MKRKIFLSISILLIIFFAIYYYINIANIRIPDKVNKVKIFDHRTGKESIIESSDKVLKLTDLINKSLSRKNNIDIKELPNGPIYKITFLGDKNKQLYAINLYGMNTYYLINTSIRFKTYNLTIKNDKTLIDYINKISN